MKGQNNSRNHWSFTSLITHVLAPAYYRLFAEFIKNIGDNLFNKVMRKHILILETDIPAYFPVVSVRNSPWNSRCKPFCRFSALGRSGLTLIQKQHRQQDIFRIPALL